MKPQLLLWRGLSKKFLSSMTVVASQSGARQTREVMADSIPPKTLRFDEVESCLPLRSAGELTVAMTVALPEEMNGPVMKIPIQGLPT
jgi:hypothetical protein